MAGSSTTVAVLYLTPVVRWNETYRSFDKSHFHFPGDITLSGVRISLKDRSVLDMTSNEEPPGLLDEGSTSSDCGVALGPPPP